MQIMVERNIPFGKEVFQTLGRVILYDGNDLQGLSAPETEVLVTRSNVRVDRKILSRLPELIAILSPTIGVDHVDFAAIRAYEKAHFRPLPVINAPGSTAGGVGDYVLASVMQMQDRGRLSQGCTVGIWGYGNCGRAVAARLRTINCDIVAYDPPLQQRSKGHFRSATPDGLLSTDCITVHLPLTTKQESPWPTQGIISSRILGALKNKVLINTSRGDVLDEGAAVAFAKKNNIGLVLDVYKSEPAVDPDLVRHTVISTPHVAGSIRQGKVRALKQVYDRLCSIIKVRGNYNFQLAMERIRSPFQVSALPLITTDRKMVMDVVKLEQLSGKLKAIFSSKNRQNDLDFVNLRKRSMRDEIIWPAKMKDNKFEPEPGI